MHSDETRMALMEKRLNDLTTELGIERQEFKTLKKQFEETHKKITTAETVGRLAIWILLGASAFLTQVQGVLTWIRKG